MSPSPPPSAPRRKPSRKSSPKSTNKPKKLIPVKLKRKDGVVQTYFIRGRERAAQHPQKATPSERRKAARKPSTAPKARRAARSAAMPRAAPAPVVAPSEREPATAVPGGVVRRVPPPVVVGSRGERFQPRAGGVYTTWFKAFGTEGSLGEMRGVEFGDSPTLLGEDLDEVAAPAAFYSNQSGLLGRVKWPGIIPVLEMIDLLNLQLQFVGEEVRGFDFREVYGEWEYKYQVIEVFDGVDVVVVLERDGSHLRRIYREG